CSSSIGLYHHLVKHILCYLHDQWKLFSSTDFDRLSFISYKTYFEYIVRVHILKDEFAFNIGLNTPSRTLDDDICPRQGNSLCIRNSSMNFTGRRWGYILYFFFLFYNDGLVYYFIGKGLVFKTQGQHLL